MRAETAYDDPLTPIEDVLRDLIGPEEIKRLIDDRLIEIMPLRSMRGRTFNDSFVAVDEARNLTRSKMRMALTRLGSRSRMVIASDPAQVDLRGDEPSGLIHILQLMAGADIAPARIDRVLNVYSFLGIKSRIEPVTPTSEQPLMNVLRLLVLLSIAIFGGEIAIMFALDHFPVGNRILTNIIDATALIVIVFPILYYFVFKSILVAKEHLEDGIRARTADIEEANRALEHSIRTLNFHQQEMVLLGEMGNFFQACRDIDEAMIVAEVQLSRLFPDISGALFLMNSSRNILEKTVAWGQPVAIDNHHAPEDCWALRRSKPHVVGSGERALTCQHMRSIEAPWQICLPLAAQGEALGILCLLSNGEPSDTMGHEGTVGDERMKFYVAAAENLALTVANLRLRETLRYQALRDPLTGLFNRRYLLDTLERELDRAAERDQAVSVVMFDIDHFKRFNDAFGHVAGDTVLARLGAFLREWARGEDVTVRYGGEEFTVVLPDTPADLAFRRVESLRRGIESLAIEHHGQPLGRVTISAGVATFPLQGVDRDGLIHLADEALYRSKRSGRNRTTMAADVASPAQAPTLEGAC